MPAFLIPYALEVEGIRPDAKLLLLNLCIWSNQDGYWSGDTADLGRACNISETDAQSTLFYLRDFYHLIDFENNEDMEITSPVRMTMYTLPKGAWPFGEGEDDE